MTDPTTTGPTGPDQPRSRSLGAAHAPITANLRFSQPVRQITLMLAVLGLVAIGGWLAYGRILPIFLANKWLNGLILAVFVIGVLACFWQVAQLVRSVSWIERFAARRRPGTGKATQAVSPEAADEAPRLLAPLAALLGGRGPTGGVISTGSAQSILDSVATRIDELRDITRYLTNLLIFLGLLGTFYGLATTVPAVVETIRALAPQEGESGLAVFEKLMGGLEAQLGGMATAFSSSLLGLAGSLVVGLLELFVTHGQNRFYRELEEWMSGFTRVSLAAEAGDGTDQAAMGGFLEQLGQYMERLEHYHAERDAMRDQAAAEADERVVMMARAVENMASQSDHEREATISRAVSLTEALNRLAEGQERIVTATRDRASSAPDLAGVETALHRLVADMNDGREEMLSELRSDLLVLTRAVRAARFNDPFRDDQLGGPGHRSGGGSGT